MYRYYELLTDVSLAEIETLKKKIAAGETHPMDAKLDLARRIVTDFHSAGQAKEGLEAFRRVVQQGQAPENIAVFELPSELRGESTIRVDKLLRQIGLCASGAEANRKLSEGAVSINGVKHTAMSYDLPAGTRELLIQVGKKWGKVVV
jgi:tyrosyl-tRNA synthetase